MSDSQSWIDPDLERVQQKMAQFIQAATKNNCPNLPALQNLVAKFQAGEPLI